MPLVSAGGAIGALLRGMGVRVPVGFIEGGGGGRGRFGGRSGGFDGFGRGGRSGYSRGYEYDGFGERGTGEGGGGLMGNLGSVLKIAQAFM